MYNLLNRDADYETHGSFTQNTNPILSFSERSHPRVHEGRAGEKYWRVSG